MHHSILGSVLGSGCFGKLPFELAAPGNYVLLRGEYVGHFGPPSMSCIHLGTPLHATSLDPLKDPENQSPPKSDPIITSENIGGEKEA